MRQAYDKDTLHCRLCSLRKSFDKYISFIGIHTRIANNLQ